MQLQALALFCATALLEGALCAQVSIAWSDVHSDNQTQYDRTIASSVFAHPGGGFVAGCTVVTRKVQSPFPPYWDVDRTQLVRWSGAGQKQWVRALAGPGGLIGIDPQGVSYALVNVGGVQTLQAVDSSGAVLWTSPTLGGWIRGSTLSPNGDIVFASTLVGPGGTYDMLIFAWSNSGALRWSRLIDGPQSGSDDAWCVTCDTNGDVIVGGRFSFYSGPTYYSNAVVVRLDANGNPLWVTSVGQPIAMTEEPDSICVTSAGDIVLSGQSVGQPSHAHIARLTSAGSVLWEQQWAYSSPMLYYIPRVVPCADGSTWSSLWVYSGPTSLYAMLHHAPDGTLTASPIFGSPTQCLRGQMLAQGSAGDFRLVSNDIGPYSVPGYQDQGWMMSMDQSGGACWVRNFQSTPATPRQLFSAVASSGNFLAVTGTDSYTDPPAGPSGGIAQIIVFDLSDSPSAYCTAKANSQGCTPTLSFTGLSSVAATSGFSIRASSELNQRPAMMLYGLSGGAATPFQGGTLCLAPPVRRTPGMSAGGTPLPAVDCSGVLALDMNAFAHGLLGGNPQAALLVAGTAVNLQAWGRDPGFAAPNNTSLSNGLRFVVLP